MTKINQPRTNRFAFWQRGPRPQEITGYHVGNIHSDVPVRVAIASTLVGNVVAPQVEVAGLLTGHVVTRSFTIGATGQMWGNVSTMACHIETGGKLQGWVTAVDEETYLRLHAAGVIPNGQGDDVPRLSPEASAAVQAAHDPATLTIMRQLQDEAAIALAARAELEQDFDNRLAEVAGDATAKIADLQEQLATASQEITKLEQQTDLFAQALNERETQVSRQSGELSNTRELLTDRKKEVGSLRQALDERNQKFDELFTAKAEVDGRLAAAESTIEEQEERLRSIEAALQSSLQHSAEQEDSLIRWQELAESTEQKAETLNKELDNANLRIEEATNTINLLRDQRQQIEKELAKATQERDELRQKSTSPLSNKTVTQLQMQLVDLEEKSQEHYEQMLWFKANAETTQQALEETRAIVASQEKVINQFETDLAAKQQLIKKWKGEIADMRQRLLDKDNRIQDLQTALAEMEQSAGVEINNLKESALHARLKHEASEVDLSHLQEEVKQQGKRLAGIQSELVERDLQLAQAQEVISKQRAFIQQIRRVADNRIKQLQQQIASLQAQAEKQQQV